MRFLLILLLIITINNKINCEQIIFFIHGLNSSPKSFKKMEKDFSKEYKTINFGYNSKYYSIEEISENLLKPAINKIPENDTINFITHSMGAILLRFYIKNHKIKNIGKIIMIAPPNNGSDVANFFKNFILYKIFYHKAGQSLSYEDIKNLNLPDCNNLQCGIIAGTYSLLPFFSIFIKGKDDGKISVKNTKLKGMKDFITVQYSHDNITKKNEVIRYCKNFIKFGKFLPD